MFSRLALYVGLIVTICSLAVTSSSQIRQARERPFAERNPDIASQTRRRYMFLDQSALVIAILVC